MASLDSARLTSGVTDQQGRDNLENRSPIGAVLTAVPAAPEFASCQRAEESHFASFTLTIIHELTKVPLSNSTDHHISSVAIIGSG
jgi:hypothetical protein